MRVAVLAGGRSLERAVSQRSGARVELALTRLGHEPVPLDADGGLGAALAAGSLGACAPDREHLPPRDVAARGAAGVLDADDRALVDGIADTLLPTTAASPGAKAAGVGAAVNLLLTD